MNISSKILSLLLVLAFIAGIFFGAARPTKTITVEVTKNEIHWRDLKQLDDKIFIVKNRLVSASFSEIIDDSGLDKLVEEEQFLLSERDLVLLKLGY